MRNTTATPAVEIAPAFPHAAAAPAMNNATVTPTSRNYPLLLASQFLGAFGDNALLVIMLGGVKRAFDAGRITAQQQQLENIFYTSVLFIPYVPLAPLAGFLNDRFAKSRWLLGGNLIKIAGALLTLLSVWHGAAWLAIGYAVVGVGSCFYSPAKYGILPEILPTARLVKANGSVELLTLVAILTGTIGGAVMADHLAAVVAYAAVVGIYAASLALNLFMEKTPAYPEVKLSQTLGGFAANLRFIFTGRRLARVLLGTSLFWICGALMKMNFQPWGQQVLHLASNTQISLLGLWLSVGVMIGSVLAGQLHAVGELGATRRYGWLLAAAIGLLAAVGWFMGHGLAHPQPFVIGVLAVAGVFAGLFLIPLNAALQAESHQDKLGKTIATQNCLENIAMLGGSAFAWVNVNAGVDPSQLFLGLAALVAVVVCFLKIPVAKTEAQA